MLLFSDVLYMLVRYASPSAPMLLRCLMLTVLVNCLLNASVWVK